MLNLNNIYAYYSSYYPALRNQGRTDSNKKEKTDLKAVYQNMVKQTQHSPFYKFTLSDTTQSYAIGIKEAAMALEQESESLGNIKDNVFDQMTASSDNENVVYAQLHENGASNIPDRLTVRVDALATNQTNVGTYLPSGECSFRPGDYSFGIAVGQNQYTFHIHVQDGDTNQSIQRNLAASINQNDIGVHAGIRNNRMEGTSALVLRSEAVGKPDTGELFFQFDETYLSDDIASALGVDQVESAPSNAEFYINDTYQTSAGNRITLNHAMDLDLLSVSDAPVHIELIPDEEKISDRLNDFLDSYNTLVDIARNGAGQKNASHLLRDITGIASRNETDLRRAGILIQEDGHLQKADDIDSDQIRGLFDDSLSGFRKDVSRITEKMSLNPLTYIDKTVVTYPNTSGTYPNPYLPSRYSGLMFNDYA